jgi:peptidoglycan/LPS O-acetylase OafA/YrhL
MRQQRIDVGSILVAVGAALLLVSLFLQWYDPAGTGWQVFEALDILLAGIALGVLGAVAGTLGSAGDGRGWWVPGLAACALLVVAVQLIDLPPAARGADRAVGAWLALAGSALLVLGALLQRMRISISVDLRERETRHRVPAVDRREEADEPRVERTQPVDLDDRPRE